MISRDDDRRTTEHCTKFPYRSTGRGHGLYAGRRAVVWLSWLGGTIAEHSDDISDGLKFVCVRRINHTVLYFQRIKGKNILRTSIQLNRSNKYVMDKVMRLDLNYIII